MMYYAYDAISKASRPMYHMSMLGKTISEHPLNPLSYTPLAKLSSAVFESTSRSLRCYEKLGFDCPTTTVDGKTVIIKEEVVVDLPFCQLLHFKKKSAVKQPKVLVMAPLSGHHATLLKGTVQSLLPKHDVYITDWKDARNIPLREGRFGMNEYVDTVLDFMEALGPNTHIFAVCQPSIQALVVGAILNQRKSPLVPPSITIMAGPVDTRINPTVVNDYASGKTVDFFEKNVISTVPPSFAGGGRKVYPGFLQLFSFMSMNIGSHIDKHVSFVSDLISGRDDSADNHREFYDEYLAVMDMPSEFYLECVEQVFINHELARGMMSYRDEKIDLEAITQSALLTVEGGLDDICGPGQTEVAQRLCSNIPDDKRKHYVQEDVGHYGVFNGSRFRNGILPQIESFIAEHDGANTKASAKAKAPADVKVEAKPKAKAQAKAKADTKVDAKVDTKAEVAPVAKVSTKAASSKSEASESISPSEK